MKMKYKDLLRSIIVLLISIFLLSAAVFAISRLTPIDPLVSYYGERVEKMTEDEKDTARGSLGLNEPIFIQYGIWLKNAMHGDFGISYKYKMPAGEVIKGRFLNSVILCGTGFVIIFAGSVAIGIFCAKRENSRADRIVCKIGNISSCIPEFWIALILIYCFSIRIHIFPSGNAYSIGGDGFFDRMHHLILPLIVVVIGHLWYYSHMVRNMLLEEKRRDYVLLYKSIGLTDYEIIRRHCLRNIMPEFISIMAISMAHILGGTYVTEIVFSYPGLGTLAYEAARYSDYNLLMLVCLITGFVIIGFNILGQIISESIDPRVAIHEKSGEEVYVDEA